MSVELYVHLRLGLRTTSSLISYLSERLSWELKDIPSPGSIKNWVEKSGYEIYAEPAYNTLDDSYAQIIDESMMVGTEKLLLSLGVKAEKEGESALCF
ncbi:MAG: hypothetical protein LBC68_00250, partial [Prevotellaceae bacterium]|nr:hypothetical protein [Prevotellaceae bacterium]